MAGTFISKIPAALEANIAPALTSAFWDTLNTGWRYLTSPNRLDKNDDGTGVATPASLSITAGVTYKVVIVIDSISGSSATYTLGGASGSILDTATTYTDYITASTTDKLIITPTGTLLRITISSITIQVLASDTGDLIVDGNLRTNSPAFLMGGNVGINTILPKSRFHIAGHTSLDDATIDTGINLSKVVRHPAFTAVLAGAGGGNVNTGTHYYYVSYKTLNGETELSIGNGGVTFWSGYNIDNAGVLVTTTDLDGQVDINVTASTDYRVTGINIYRTTTDSVYYQNCYLVRTITNETQTYRDNISDDNRSGVIDNYERDNTTNSQIYINSSKALWVGPINTTLGLGAGANLGVSSTYNVFMGNNAGAGTTSGHNNVFIGADTGQDTNVSGAVGIGSWAFFSASGTNSVAIGNRACFNNSGSNNVAVGNCAGQYAPNPSATTAGGYNVFIGSNTGSYNTSGTNSIHLGYNAGAFDRSTQKLYIDSIDRTTESLGRAQSLFYGTFNSTVASQLLTINAGNTYIADTGTLGPEKISDYNFTDGSSKWTVGAAWKGDNTPFGYVFSTTDMEIAPAPGDTYSNNGIEFTIGYIKTPGVVDTISAFGSGNPTTSGVLEKVSGSGSSPIAFSSFNRAAIKYNDGITTLSQTSETMATPLVVGEMYYLSYTISNWVAGTVTPTCGDAYPAIPATAGFYDDGTYSAMFVATSTADLIFTPTGSARFAIDNISLKKVIGGALQTGGNVLVGGTVGTSTIKTDTGTPTDLSITTGTLKTLVLASPVYNDLPPFPLNMARITGTTPPALAQFNGTTCYQQQFTLNDEVHGNTELTHEYKENTDVEVHIHWSPAVSDGSDRGVCWKFDYQIAAINGTFTAGAALSVDVTIPASTAAFKHYVSAMTTKIPGSGLTIGTNIIWRIKRIATAVGGGNPSVNPFGIALGMHVEIDTMGSRDWYAK